jgi:hypothetical protein
VFKRFIYLTIIFVMLSSGVAAADLWSRFSISLAPGTLLSLHGNYTESQKLNDTVLPGAGLGLIFRYKLSEYFFIDAGYGYNWMFFRKDIRPSGYETHKPAFIAPTYTLNGTFFLGSGRKVKPYITLGGGICPWRFSSEAFGGELWAAPENTEENFSKASLSLNGGLGIEVMLWSKLSVFGEAKYYYIFAKDEKKFGTVYFNNQGLLGIRLGATFYFGRKESLETDKDQK